MINVAPSLAPSLAPGIIIAAAVGCWTVGRAVRTLSYRRQLALALVATVLPLVAALLVAGRPAPLILCLLATIVLSTELSLRFAQAWFAVLVMFAVLLVPMLLGQGVADPALSIAGQAWAYVVAALALVLWRLIIAGLGESFDTVGVAGYFLAFLIALGYAVESGPAAVLGVGLAIAACLFYLSRWEPPAAGFVYAASLVAGYALTQIPDLLGWPLATNALILAGSGVALYLVGRHVAEGDSRGPALCYAGLVLAFLGVYPGLLSFTPPLEPTLALATAAVLLWTEGLRQGRLLVAELGGGLIILAFDWVLRHYGVHEIQWYTLPFAAYFAHLAYRRRELEHDTYDLLAGLALAFLTIPLAGQALAPDGQGYGIALVFESLGLISLGSAINYRLVTLWGALTLITAGLYQLGHIMAP
jgi:hypothetical protein